jgi:hypothetical protein
MTRDVLRRRAALIHIATYNFVFQSGSATPRVLFS